MIIVTLWPKPNQHLSYKDTQSQIINESFQIYEQAIGISSEYYLGYSVTIEMVIFQ